MSTCSEGLEVNINSSFLTCFDSKLSNGEIDELSILKNMFKHTKCYLENPEDSKYRSKACTFDIGNKFKCEFEDISLLSSYEYNKVIIQIHNYVRFLHIFCRDIIIPIHTKIYKSATTHDKTYNIINEILKSTSNLINIIESKYDDSTRYMEGVGSFSITGDVHCTYYIYIEPIYVQLKNLNNLLIQYI